MNNGGTSAVLHAEADQHEAAIIAAIQEMIETIGKAPGQSKNAGPAKVMALESAKSTTGRAA